MEKYIRSQTLHKKKHNDDEISYSDCDNDDDDDTVDGIDVVHCALGWLLKESGKEHLPGRLPHK